VTSKLNPSASKEHKISKSAVLAGAALALPFAANADVIVDPTQDQTITSSSTDSTGYLTVNGINEFLFTASVGSGTDSVGPVASGAGYVGTGTNIPMALSAGATIGAGSNFETGTGILQSTGKAFQQGPWPNDPNTLAYLGVEFLIGGDLHYGWVGLTACTPDVSTDCQGGKKDPGVATIQITGFAYESAVKTPIQAGAVPEPSQLPLLALGAAGVAALRARRKRAA
jgi:hypothetical protein